MGKADGSVGDMIGQLIFHNPGKGECISKSRSQLDPEQKVREPFWTRWGWGRGPDWTMLFFMAPAKGGAFPDQAPNSIPNAKSREHFGKGRGGFEDLIGQSRFLLALASGP